MKEEFSVEDGVVVQHEQLKMWKAVLNTKAFIHLCEICNKDNAKPKRDGYDVLRGVMLDEKVTHYAMELVYGKLEF